MSATRCSNVTRPPLYGNLTQWALVEAESLTFMTQLPDDCVDAVVTDPPYGIAINGKDWDGGAGNQALATGHGFQVFCQDWASQVHRILKPGGHLVAFGASRNWHRLTSGIEDAGLEIRDGLLWLYSSGLPKSRRLPGGQGTALKPSYEPAVVARKPLARRTSGKPGTVADNVSRYRTGALNIDASRIPRADSDPGEADYWPPNVVLSHDPICTDTRCSDECAVAAIDRIGGDANRPLSRIFHAGKASQAEREIGLDGLKAEASPIFSAVAYKARPRRNVHPTVKPLSVMEWIIRLVTPENSLVVDPFAGSGSTGCAAMLAGRSFLGIEQETEYVAIARARLRHWARESHRRAS